MTLTTENYGLMGKSNMQPLILTLYPEFSKRIYARNIISVHYIMIRDKNKKEKKIACILGRANLFLIFKV